MAEIWLVRHGQASLGTDNYDQLSALGQQQARWLGQHLVARAAQRPVHLVSGQMARQIQTADAIAESLPLSSRAQMGAFNEFDFESVVLSWLEQNPGYPLAASPSAAELRRLLYSSMGAWAEGKLSLPEHKEPWPAFHQRVAGGWETLQPATDSVLMVVSSAGAIASVLRHVMRLDNAATLELNLQICNASVTRLVRTESGTALTGFNDVGYLESADRAHAITFA